MIRLTRRRFLLAAGSAAAGVGLYTWRIEPHWVDFVRRDLPIRNLPSSLAGRTLAQVSDIHVGPRVDSDYLSDSLRALSSLQPDIVCFTGDFMSAGDAARVGEVARVVESLAAPPLGAYAVLGNHDYGEGWRDSALAERLSTKLAETGIRVLRNAAVDVGGFGLMGVDDMWGTNFNPTSVLGGVNPDAPSLVLCHNPDAADLPVWGGYRGWILSGHTHGGQCKPPFLPPPILPVKNHRYTAGVFDLDGGRSLYINRGLGHLKRVRFNVRPEITLHTLQAI